MGGLWSKFGPIRTEFGRRRGPSCSGQLESSWWQKMTLSRTARETPARTDTVRTDHPRHREMDTSRIEVKAPTWDAEIAPIMIGTVLSSSPHLCV